MYMQSQKLTAQLNLALNLTEEERRKSVSLEVGYDAASREWELIVRYINELDTVAARYGASVSYLLGEYAIVTIKEEFIPAFSMEEAVIYVEKPNSIYIETLAERQASCISRVQTGQEGLSGKQTLLAVIDSGIDYAHPDFRKEDGSTRIMALWDQTALPDEVNRPPQGYTVGVEYTEKRINEALQKRRTPEQLAIVPEVDLSGHGTFVTGIAAGNGRASQGQNRGVAYEADLLVVKLGNPRKNGFPRTIELMLAIDYVVRFARKRNMPLALNMSYGNNYGSHQGDTLLETYLNTALDSVAGCGVVGMGNEGNADKHAMVQVVADVQTSVPFAIAEGERALNLQLWKNYLDDIRIYLVPPDGRLLGPLPQTLGVTRIPYGSASIDIYYDVPKPYQIDQLIYFDFIANGDRLPFGEWNILLIPERIVHGMCHFWLPVSEALQSTTRFLLAGSFGSFTIPSAAKKVISVGAYNSRSGALASFSGRGMLPFEKPDLVAPGVDVTSCALGGGYTVKSGTSVAAPFVAGAASLLLEWGIVKRNDPYLYGEKLKAYLQKGARPLSGYQSIPNPYVGYGALCVSDAIPGMR